MNRTHKLQTKIEKSLVDGDDFIELYEIEEQKLIDRGKRWLIENKHDPDILNYTGVWIGGSENCRCAGCADCLNSINTSYDKDHNYIMTLTIDYDEIREWIDGGCKDIYWHDEEEN